MSKVGLGSNPTSEIRPARIIGHCGAAGLVPENTLTGFRKAKEAGATWVECDVVLPGDGTPIMFHDLALDKMTSGSCLLANRGRDTVMSLDAGNWFAHLFVTRQQVEETKAAGLVVGLFTVNDLDRVAALFSWGAKSLFTDLPNLFDRSLLAQPA